MNFLHFLVYMFKKNMTFVASEDNSKTKKNGFPKIMADHLSAINKIK